ncbi:hypothetical protein [Clostridium sp. 1xD42-85]
MAGLSPIQYRTQASQSVA